VVRHIGVILLGASVQLKKAYERQISLLCGVSQKGDGVLAKGKKKWRRCMRIEHTQDVLRASQRL
jgi:hypothetical protein